MYLKTLFCLVAYFRSVCKFLFISLIRYADPHADTVVNGLTHVPIRIYSADSAIFLFSPSKCLEENDCFC